MRRIDPSTLRRVAEHHLGRHPSTRANLVRVLERRVKSSVRTRGLVAPENLGEMIDDVVASLVRDGLVDDRRLADSKARTMRASGKSAIAVRTKLRQKGVEAAVVEAVFRAEREASGTERSAADVELDAARALVRRKKLGPMHDDRSPERRQKDLATIARAGFSYDIARRALATSDSE